MAKSVLALKKADDLFEKSAMSFGDHLEATLDGALLQTIGEEGGRLHTRRELVEIVQCIGDVVESEANTIWPGHFGAQISRSASRSTASAT